LPPAEQAYNINREKLLVLKKYLMEQLEKGYYCSSKSPVASLILFTRKPGGSLRFCINYRALNNITIKNRYSISIIQETLYYLSKAKIYTKLDINAAFNKIRIKEGNE